MSSATSGSDSLAEWSQKIKNLQQQVNEDGLQEQARLEAEIAKSRMERANRRSTLTGNARVDQASASYLSRLPDRSPDQEPRADALQRLQGTHPVDNSRGSIPTPGGGSSQVSQGMSLAEFMGGRATGPRLNKHAPQLDYQEHISDYESRSRTGAKPLLQQMASPAPVALHGLAKDLSRKESPIPSRIQADSPSSVSKSVPVSTTTTSVVSSTSPPSNGSSSSPAREKPVFLRQTTPTSPPVSNPVKSSTFPSPAASPPWATPSTPVSARWVASNSPVSAPKSPPASSSPRVEMLARPVQPSPSPMQRFIPATNPSPAFLKPGPQKEERPSITRLQGRGFVEKQVRASARLSLSATPEEAAKIQRPTTAEKKVSVLERWPGESGQKPASTSPPANSDIPKRDFRRSLPATSPSFNVAPAKSLVSSAGIGVGPSRVAAFVAATNENSRARNPEHDSTPLRLPGMGGAGPLPFKSRSQTDPSKEIGGSAEQASLSSTPRRLPGLAADATTPSVLKKSSSSTDLRAPRRQRSVHFDDPEENERYVPKVVGFDGNQTDAANSKKLVHMTKDRARKPRKPGAKSGLSVESSASPNVEDSASQGDSADQNRKGSLEPTSSFPSSKARTDTAPESSSEVPVPTTPVSARPSSREGRAKIPPPIIAPKPAALRRNSQPTPTEKNAPSFPRQYQAASPPDKEPVSALSPGTQDNIVSPSTPSNGDAIPSSISVKAAASSWGKQGSGEVEAGGRQTDSPRPTSSVSDVTPGNAPEPSEPPIVVPSILNPPAVPMPQPRPRPLSQSSERRRSISNRYSAIILPPLKEEKTPVATPEGSLKRPTNQGGNVPSAQSLHDSLVSASRFSEPTSQVENLHTLAVTPSVAQGTNGNSPISPLDRTVVIAHEDAPVPAFNLSRLLASVPATPKLVPGAAISTETFLISGSSSTAIKENMHVFYDGEIIAVVYRGKSKTSGLVATTVWGWIGSNATLTEKETEKLQDMASRFNTSLAQVPQGKEPYDLVQLLGGTLAIRRGSRSHWSPENTALHCVRMHGSHFVVIEEIELMSRNICSAFSYCLAILDALFVWQGRGSLPAERSAAQSYAKTIVSEGVEPTKLEEGEEDDMFWMMLDEGGYANADFWRFRTQLPPQMVPSPRLWAVSHNALQPVIPFAAADLTSDSVLMYDGVFELFVLVGEDARGRRADIRLAVAAAEGVAAASAVTRSFPPPVHVLIFPTRVPIDLRANFRGMDQREANGPAPPDHINLLTLEEARSQLDQQEWTLRQLKDPQFLPLAISPGMHPEFNSTL